MIANKLDIHAFEGGGRGLFLREILAVILAILTAMVALSLVSASLAAPAAAPGAETNWIGPFGRITASGLIFVLGAYVAWLPPLMLAALTVQAWRGTGVWFGGGWALVRAAGGGAMVVSLCACLALCAPADDAGEAFHLGGMLGNWLIDAKGCDLGALLGRAGAMMTFGGAAVIGAILFTDTLLREAARGLWRGASKLGQWRRWLRRPAWLRMPRWQALDWFAAAWHGVGVVTHWTGRLIQKFIARLRGMEFERPRDARFMPVAPIVELTALPGTGFRRPSMDDEDPTPPSFRMTEVEEEDEEAPQPAPRRARSSRVMGGMFEAEPAAETPARMPASRRAAPAKAAKPAAQNEMELFPDEYHLPPLSLLTPPPDTIYTMSPAEREALGARIKATLAEFKIEVDVIDVVQGPVVTRFALRVAAGVRVSRILQLESELAMSLRAQHVRILAPIPGQAAVGIEVPNPRPNPVVLRELLESEEFRENKAPLGFALGKGISGDAVVSDLAKMPHLLIAGATGSGKSVCLNTIIASLLFRNKPDEVKFVMVDPKRVELSIYQAIPHLVAPVVSEPKKAAAALAWCVDVMEQRYKLLAEMGVRNIDGYNGIVRSADTARPHKKCIGRNDLKLMPHYVIIIDELADLMLVAKNEVEEYVIRLAQMARAVGMHLILATQRPSVNVITGLIKANFPSRIAFQVSSKVDSRTILDMNGAEALMGRGDMLYSPGGVKPFRIQGAFVSDAEVERLADTIREQQQASYEKDDFEPAPTPAERAKAQLMAGAMPGGAMARGVDGLTGGAVYDPNRPEMGEGDGYAGWDDEDQDAAPAARRIAAPKAPSRGAVFGGGFGRTQDDPDSQSPSVPVRARPCPSVSNAPTDDPDDEEEGPGRMATRGFAGAAPLSAADLNSLTDEDLYDVALRLVLESKKASVSYIQRRLKIGYARAGRLMDMMEERGIVGPYQGSKPRDLRVDADAYLRQM